MRIVPRLPIASLGLLALLLVPSSALAKKPKDDGPPPWDQFAPVPFAQLVNPAFGTDFDGKWVKVDAVFNSASGWAVEMQLECRLAVVTFTCADVPFVVADPTSGALWGGVAMDKELATVLFTLKPGEAITLYGRSAAFTVPQSHAQYEALKVYKIEERQ